MIKPIKKLPVSNEVVSRLAQEAVSYYARRLPLSVRDQTAELYQQAWLVVLQAAQTYKAPKNVVSAERAFTAYAAQALSQGLRRYFNNMKTLVHVPRTLACDRATESGARAMSFDAPVPHSARLLPDAADGTVADTLMDRSESPFEVVARMEARARLNAAVDASLVGDARAQAALREIREEGRLTRFPQSYPHSLRNRIGASPQVAALMGEVA